MRQMSVFNTAIKVIPVLLLACISSGCDGPGNTDNGTVNPLDTPQPPARGFYMGLLPIPADGQSLEDSYLQASSHAEWAPVWSSGIGAAGFWDYAEKLSGGTGASVLSDFIRGNGMFPLVHFSFIDKDTQTGDLILKAPDTMPQATLSDTAWRNAYTKAVLDVVKTVKPRYVSVGNEVNRWYEQHGAGDSADGFQHFVSLYESIYDAVKLLAPDTLVFCTFAREVVDELRQADTGVLGMFDSEKMDILVLTSYPYSVRKDAGGEMLEEPHNQPSDIPDTYYAEVLQYMPGKPLGFSEIAWPATEFYGGEEGQAGFITEVSGRLTIDQGISLHLLGWPWLHDLSGGDETGLIRRDGTEKKAYGVWKELSSAQ